MVTPARSFGHVEQPFQQKGKVGTSITSRLRDAARDVVEDRVRASAGWEGKTLVG